VNKRPTTLRDKILRRIRENPGTMTEDIKVAYRMTYPLRELEREGLIEYRGGVWYAKGDK
jgi:predicted transcriptional regulator